MSSRRDLAFLGPSHSAPLVGPGGTSHLFPLLLSWAENKGGKSGSRQHFCYGLEPSGCGPQPDRQGINRDYRRVLSPTVPVFNDRTLLTKEETFTCFLHFAPRFPLWHAYFVGLRIKCELVMEAEPARPWPMRPSNCLTSRVELA